MPLESTSAYNMYLFNFRIENHILINIFKQPFWDDSSNGYFRLAVVVARLS